MVKIRHLIRFIFSCLIKQNTRLIFLRNSCFRYFSPSSSHLLISNGLSAGRRRSGEAERNSAPKSRNQTFAQIYRQVFLPLPPNKKIHPSQLKRKYGKWNRVSRARTPKNPKSQLALSFPAQYRPPIFGLTKKKEYRNSFFVRAPENMRFSIPQSILSQKKKPGKKHVACIAP